MKNISLIAAMGRNRVIGNQGKIPWNLPADLLFFKDATFGRPVIMGRKTHESIGRALPGRKNIVVTSQEKYVPLGDAVPARTLEEAFALAGEEEVFVIGGAQIYAQAIPFADRLYLTCVSGDFSGDTLFPEFDMREWKKIWHEKRTADQKNPHPFEWMILERIL